MRLTKRNILPYVLNKAFIEMEAVVNGNFAARQTLSRHSIFQVMLGEGEGRFIKQLQDLNTQEIYRMQKDATAHYLFHQSELYSGVKKHVPAYYGYDLLSHVLVLGFFQASPNLYEWIVKQQGLNIVHSELIADIFTNFHKDISAEIPDNPSLQFYNREIPWVLNVPEFATSQPQEMVFQLIQNDEILCEQLDQLRQLWSGNSLIHGDIKLVNFLVKNNNGTDEIKLVDWETSNIGDPLWDVAGLIQSYLSSWVFAQFSGADQTVAEAQKTFDIAQCQRVLAAFWQRYAKNQQWKSEQEKTSLNKTMQFTAARLLQTAKEVNQMNPTQLMPSTLQLVQMAQNIFKSPETAASDFLGEVL